MIHTSGRFPKYPHIAISTEVLDSIQVAKKPLLPGYHADIPAILRTLECFLQLTNQSLDHHKLTSPLFVEICYGYIGAIYSDDIFETLSLARKYRLCNSFLILASRLEILSLAHPLPPIKLALSGITEDINIAVKAFRKLDLDAEKIWVWEGWPCENKNGVTYWAPLYPIYSRLGKQFTEKLHQACKLFFSSRNSTRICCLSSLALYIDSYNGKLEPEDFTNPEFMGKFWRSFLTYYLVTSYSDGKGSKLVNLTNNWRSHFRLFVTSYLNKPGFISTIFGEFPCPPAMGKRRRGNTNIKTTEDGVVVSEKLITHIPLHVTDENAMELLFNEIEADVNIITNWASWAANDIWKRYLRRCDYSDQGEVVKILKKNNDGNGWRRDRNNPDYLKNAATTLKHYGHIDKEQNPSLIFPQPLAETAYELALPTTGALLPHCILLVAHHPSITPSFLENLELFDKNERLIGFVETDGGHKLIGNKLRKGPKLAEQIIQLNEETTEIVHQIILLTKSLRDFLKNKGDDSWRYLLLTCGSGFGYPLRYKRLATETQNPVRTQRLADSLSNTCSLSSEERNRYVKRFSLPSLRASCGVMVYIKTRSVKEMSKALGHAEYDSDLIKSYLPEPILSFFQERWIRIFQTGIVIEALTGSDYLVIASGFETIDQLDEFMKNHSLNLTGQRKSTDHDPLDANRNDSKVLFEINSSILTILLSLELAVKNSKDMVCAKAKYWALLSTQIFKHIDDNANYRPDLLEQLNIARSNANPLSMESIIYG